MPRFVPVAVVGEVIGKRIAARFESIAHIHNGHSRCSETVDEGCVYPGSLRAASGFADPQSPRRNYEDDYIAPGSELSKPPNRASQRIIGDILLRYSFEVESDETELHGNAMKPCRLMYEM